MLKSSRPDKEKSLCWNKAESSRSIRIEQLDGSVLIIPYVHLLFAHLEGNITPHTLQLTFSSHEIRITGTGLSELAKAIQQFAVDWVKPSPPRYQQSGIKGLTIDTITISERQ